MSTGAWASLNLGFHVGDTDENVAQNLVRAAALAEVAPGRLSTVLQVHGTAVVEASAPVDVQGVPPPFAEADALWTARRGQAVGVRVADCVPLLLLDVKTRRVAALHAGWKGTLGKIGLAALGAWQALGTRPADVRAVIGPCIRPCCYEVSDELADRFAVEFGTAVTRVKGARRHLDLPFALRHQLTGAGIPADQIGDLDRCTSCEPADFFSHRRDRGQTGRHLGFITCGP